MLNGKNTVGIGKKLYPGKYILACDRSDQLMNIGPQDYPFPIGNVGTIDSSSVSLNFYPYFYNWQVHREPKYCTTTRIPIVVNALGNSDVNNSVGFHLYPNPATDKINVTSKSKFTSKIFKSI